MTVTRTILIVALLLAGERGGAAQSDALEQYSLRHAAAMKKVNALHDSRMKLMNESLREAQAYTACLKMADRAQQCPPPDYAQMQIGNKELQRIETELKIAEQEIEFIQASAPPELLEFLADSKFYSACLPLHGEQDCKEKLRQRIRSRRQP